MAVLFTVILALPLILWSRGKHSPKGSTLTVLLVSAFLIAAGASRVLETDSGNILIHDIDLESYQSFFYGGRLYRPLQAGSMNQRPGVLIVIGEAGDRYTADHAAAELAKRGFVVLSVEDFGQGKTETEPDFYTENVVDAGYSFLISRSFTDHDRVGIAAFDEGCAKALESTTLADFTSSVFVNAEDDAPDGTHSLTGSVADPRTIASVMEIFHEELAIPNDSPFWYDANQQTFALLLVLRAALFALLGLAVISLSCSLRNKALALIFPLLLFVGLWGLTANFLVSVRVGEPYSYLPTFASLRAHFRPLRLLLFVGASILGSLTVGKRKVFIIEILAGAAALAAAVLALTGANIPGVYAAAGCLLIGAALYRFAESRHGSAIVCAALSGLMLYAACCALPLSIIPL